jgi:hypothetical protein
MTNCDNDSTKQVCGTFETPTVPDEGCCYPYRTKRSCEAPLLPVITCDDDEYIVEPSDNPDKPFNIVARIFDQNCLVILDQNNLAILTIVN